MLSPLAYGQTATGRVEGGKWLRWRRRGGPEKRKEGKGREYGNREHRMRGKGGKEKNSEKGTGGGRIVY